MSSFFLTSSAENYNFVAVLVLRIIILFFQNSRLFYVFHVERFVAICDSFENSNACDWSSNACDFTFLNNTCCAKSEGEINL